MTEYVLIVDPADGRAIVRALNNDDKDNYEEQVETIIQHEGMSSLNNCVWQVITSIDVRF